MSKEIQTFVATPRLKCRFKHSWILKHNKDGNKYFICTDCPARKIIQNDPDIPARMK